MPKLIAYLLEGQSADIRPAPLERDWMDKTNQRFAYRCLPVNIANTHGWELLCASSFYARWDGRADLDAIRIMPDVPGTVPAVSHFGHGVLTFHLPCLFRTDPGIDLFVTGPLNRPKDGIAPLTGVIESDWSPYTFTMNWVFTRANWSVRFAAGEPFCHVFPVARGSLETIEPELRSLSDAPDLEQQYRQWETSRNTFNTQLREPESAAAQERWQKAYFRGVDQAGAPGSADHRSRLRLRPFAREARTQAARTAE
jgi:hypothetical protein